jgi:hypothetical protein
VVAPTASQFANDRFVVLKTVNESPAVPVKTNPKRSKKAASIAAAGGGAVCGGEVDPIMETQLITVSLRRLLQGIIR